MCARTKHQVTTVRAARHAHRGLVADGEEMRQRGLSGSVPASPAAALPAPPSTQSTPGPSGQRGAKPQHAQQPVPGGSGNGAERRDGSSDGKVQDAKLRAALHEAEVLKTERATLRGELQRQRELHAAQQQVCASNTCARRLRLAISAQRKN